MNDQNQVLHSRSTFSILLCDTTLSLQVWTAANDGCIKIWNSSEFTPIRSLHIHSSRVLCLHSVDHHVWSGRYGEREKEAEKILSFEFLKFSHFSFDNMVLLLCVQF